LSVLSGLYGRAARFRRTWYGRHPDRVHRLRHPVVSVGNLVVGGSGKTPIVSALASLLIDAGERPAILSRGYGRRRSSATVVVVSDGRSVLTPAELSGDEPQMLARAHPGVPVLVSSERYLAGQKAEDFGCSVYLLDDGFQHLQLERDVNLLVVARSDLDERVLPLGRLREPLDAAAAADALFIEGSDEDAAAISARLGVGATFRVERHYDAPRYVQPFGEVVPPSIGRRVVAVAGIARPERFFAVLRANGWDVAANLAFRDHHWFSASDLDSIRRSAIDAKADLVMTTEKDAVRLTLQPGTEPRWAYLPLHVTIEPSDRLASWLRDRLAAARSRRGATAA
jgi:tetraacyldisaccharide 4'-kinase